MLNALRLLSRSNESCPPHGGQEAQDSPERLWRDMADHKMYITGSIGAICQRVELGPVYVLGEVEISVTCYPDSCTTLALLLWCQGLLRLHLNSAYGDVIEVRLHNGFLGVL